MHRALDALAVRPEAVIVDGNRFKPYIPGSTQADIPLSRGSFPLASGGEALPHTCIVKGDGKYLSIAAASILAKTYRDDYMDGLAQEHPQYDWQSNKGYPTRRHREAIRQFGLTPYHRRTFNLTGDGQLSLDFQ